jgi:radical SAM protein (TIGR01212 family)
MYAQALALPGVVGLSVATRPDCLSPQALDLLAGYARQLEVWLELGLQTMHDVTLERINRGHTYAEFLEGYALARQYRQLKICLHMIIGLPGEGRKEVLETAQEVARLRPDGLKIHSLYIARNTELEKLYRRGNYEPLSQQDFVQSAADVLEIIPADVIIQRLTGDPNPRELVAPQWSLQKNETLKMIEAELKTRGSRQGNNV